MNENGLSNKFLHAMEPLHTFYTFCTMVDVMSLNEAPQFWNAHFAYLLSIH